MKEAEAKVRAAVAERGDLRRSRMRMRVDAPQETLAPDFDGPVREIERAGELVWPGRREQAWRQFLDRTRDAA